MNLQSALSAFSGVPADWIIIGALFIIVTADAVRAGSVRAAAIALSFPLAAVLYQLIPGTVVLSAIAKQFPTSIEQAALFAIIEIVVFVCIHQMLFSYDRYSSVLSAGVCGLAAVIAVLVVWTETPVLQSLWHFDTQIQAIFGSSYRLFWLVGSYLALAFVGS